MRDNQKARTRAAIVSAAGELMSEGIAPTLALAAERALVSRATAYRYFPSTESLLLEVAAVSPAVVPVERLVQDFGADSVGRRVERLLDTCNRIALDNEVELRTALRMYQETWLESRRESEGDGEANPVVREGRRMRWLALALAPLEERLPAPDLERLRAGLALTLNMDALAVMKDVCRLDDETALATLQWVAQSLLRASGALAGEAIPPPAQRGEA